MRVVNANKNLTKTFIVSECVRTITDNPGSVVLMPVGSVYALVCAWNDAAAREKIYKMKKSRMFQLFAWDFEEFADVGVTVSKEARKLAAGLFPGQVTIIDKDNGPNGLAFQIPDAPPDLVSFLEFSGPVAIMSAGKGAVNVKSALSQLIIGRPDAIVDNGDLPQNLPQATVIEISDSGLKIIRQGAVPEAKIRAAMGG